MDMRFTGTTNKDYIMVNAVVFTMKDGNKVVVDRDTTEYTIEEDGKFDMVWRRCYIWDSDNSTKEYLKYGNEYLVEENIESADFEIEDDAPADYEIHLGNPGGVNNG